MKIRDAIYLLLNKVTNLVFYEEVQLASAVTVAANSTMDVEIPLPTHDGYTPCAISGFNTTNFRLRLVLIEFTSSRTKVRMRAENVTSSSTTARPSVYVTYIKSPSFGGGYKPCNINAFGTLKGVAI